MLLKLHDQYRKRGIENNLPSQRMSLTMLNFAFYCQYLRAARQQAMVIDRLSNYSATALSGTCGTNSK